MIPNITASTIYSTLGNNSSLVPLAIKDVANSCGLTAASYMSGDKVEGKDRFIDEFGTQAIWLWGIPVYKKVLDFALFKPVKLDAKVDARILKAPEILKAAQELAPTKAIKNSLKEVAAHQKTFKALTISKFIASTALTSLTYLGLTKFRHKYTENQIKKELEAKQKNYGSNISFMDKNKMTSEVPFSSAFSHVHNIQNKKNKKDVTFTGMQDFIFDPVKNLMIVDASITGERLTHARNPQDFLGYVIKEGSFWAFMYLAGPMISKALEKHADKKGRSIDLDARVIESTQLEEAMKNGSLKNHIKVFKDADKSDVNIYKFAVNSINSTNSKDKNLVVEMAKMSDIIELAENTEKVDTRRFIDLKELRNVCGKLEKLLEQQKSSGDTVDKFLKSVRTLKRHAVLKNIGACIGALGIIAPAVMLIMRHFDPEYQVKKDIEKKMAALQSQN